MHNEQDLARGVACGASLDGASITSFPTPALSAPVLIGIGVEGSGFRVWGLRGRGWGVGGRA